MQRERQPATGCSQHLALGLDPGPPPPAAWAPRPWHSRRRGTATGPRNAAASTAKMISEQNQRHSRPTVAGDRGPADHRRKGTGGAADDDVLRRPALQPDGVDEDVEGDRRGQQPGGGPVDRQPHQHHREQARARRRRPARRRRHPARPESAAAGARHDRVDVAVVPHVDGTRGACADRDAEDRHRRQHRMDRRRARAPGRQTRR